jgi:hypothetical protein
LLGKYEIALAEVTRVYDDTIYILSNYASTAYYVCGESNLAKPLVAELWNRTCLACEKKEPLFWTIQTRGMVTAVKMSVLLYSIFTKKKRKTPEELIKDCVMGRRAFCRFRKEFGSVSALADAV